MYLDFKQSIHTAVKKIWPSTVTRGCRFHLGQSWYKRIQSLGLSKTYKSASAEGSYLRSFFGLAYISPDELEDFYIEDFVSYEPSNTTVQEFTDYVYENYIRSGARYPSSMWAAYSASVSRTTNACEGLHARLKDMFYHTHPDIYLLIDALLEIQERCYTKMNSIQSKKQLKRSAEKEQFIEDTMTQLDENHKITKREYVKILSRKFLP